MEHEAMIQVRSVLDALCGWEELLEPVLDGYEMAWELSG